MSSPKPRDEILATLTAMTDRMEARGLLLPGSKDRIVGLLHRHVQGPGQAAAALVEYVSGPGKRYLDDPAYFANMQPGGRGFRAMLELFPVKDCDAAYAAFAADAAHLEPAEMAGRIAETLQDRKHRDLSADPPMLPYGERRAARLLSAFASLVRPDVDLSQLAQSWGATLDQNDAAALETIALRLNGRGLSTSHDDVLSVAHCLAQQARLDPGNEVDRAQLAGMYAGQTL